LKIYTRTGDEGETSLFGGGRVRKDDVRVEAYGEVDELNAAVGLAIASLESMGSSESVERLRRVQEDLFAIGAHLATPTGSRRGEAAATHLPPLPLARIAEMEQWMDAAEERLPPLKTFILPGGSETAARLHLARTICRRAERRVCHLGESEGIAPEILVYLNRLSDLLFVLARLANVVEDREDIPWVGRS
jgi:cob(I)alamin adenosyltransferase